ncbi:hypothetical protein MEQU1_000407 [Malassezia equina]|uniref:Uncharacterized protein n=1 Tax=Malassezia equina TaxID=1381935 RepID=A0AAF0EFI0_9BASI|nr:hypothetical protein MEQU1_000407 [Malassezia equina]
MSESSSHRPLTGSPRLSGSKATVHTIGMALTIVSCVFFALSFLSSLAGLTSSAPPPTSASFAGSRFYGQCNPYLKHGYISHEPYPVWKPYDSSCQTTPILPHLLSLVPGARMGPAAALRAQNTPKQAEEDVIRAMKNRTILLVGDAVDRAMVRNLCAMVGETPVAVDASHRWGASLKQVATYTGKSADNVVLADYCFIPQYSTLVTSFYHYGADTDELWRAQPSYFPPGSFEGRLKSLLQPYLESMASLPAFNGVRASSSQPDLVVFSSGLWDLAAWAMEDESEHLDATGDLSEKRLEWWRSRMVDMLGELRKLIGNSVPLVWRSTHMSLSTAKDTVESFISNTHASTPVAPAGTGHQFAYPHRIAQLNEARKSFLPLEGRDSVRGKLSKSIWSQANQLQLRDMPFGEVTLGQPLQQDSLLIPGLDSHVYLFWSMVLFELLDSVV